jgi:hypothetical protein
MKFEYEAVLHHNQLKPMKFDQLALVASCPTCSMKFELDAFVAPLPAYYTKEI